MSETLTTKQLALDNYKNWAENATKDLRVIKTNFQDPENAGVIKKALAEHSNMNQWIDDHMIAVLAWVTKRSIHVSVNGQILEYHPKAGSETEPLTGMYLSGWNHYNCNIPEEMIQELPVDQDRGDRNLAEGKSKASVDGVETSCENKFDPDQTNVEINRCSSNVAIAENNTNKNAAVGVSKLIETMSHNNVSGTN